MNNPEREPPSSSRGAMSTGDRKTDRGSDGGPPPSSGSATTNTNPTNGPGVPSSAMAATTTNSNNRPATMPTKPTNPTTLMGQQHTQPLRSSSTESEGNGRREYATDRRPPPPPHHSDEEDDDEEDDEEDDAEDDDDAVMVMERRSSESSSGGGSGGGGGGGGGDGVPHHQSLAGSSSTSGSPMRRLPSMLRAPPSQPPPPSQHQQQVPSMYGNSNGRQAMPHYYGAGMGTTTSPRDAVSPSAGGAGTSSLLDGVRGIAQKRRLQQQQSNEYASSPSAFSGTPQQPQQQQQQQQIHQSTARALYEASQHHSSSSNSSSTVRSGGANLAHHHSTVDDDDDDDNDDPLRFETRGSHGPRDEARYETWTSKQLRKKCSHLKLRGLKNVKKHVMVEALYRYYRTQRAKSDGGGGGIGGGSGGSGGSGGMSNSGSSGNHIRGQSSSAGHSLNNGHSNNTNNNGGGRAMSSNRNDDSYADSYAQQQHRYEHSLNASSVSSNYHANSSSMGMRGVRPAAGNGGGGHAPSALNTANLQPQGRRSSPSSLTPPSRQTIRAASGGGGSLPGGVGGGAYNSTIDLEESKYDSLDNEVRITSEDVIRLVDVILSPEFVDRLKSELSRWQFWVDVREKYISLAFMNGPSSYGAARGLTALGGDQHSAPGTSSSVDNLRLPLASGYVRPSAKWSSMQLWEMWKELTFAYTKTCFEFTAAGVDERNYIQFCEGRPDVYYLHQRLHARPDLLHLIKSNEYIEEKCTSDAASEHANMSAETNAANALMGVGSPGTQPRPHKRFKRIVPAGTGSSSDRQGANGSSGAATGAGAYNGGAGGNGSGGMAVGAGATNGGNVGADANTSSSEVATPPQNAPGNNNGRPSSSSAGNGGNGGGGGGGGPSRYLTANGMRVGATSSPSGQQEEGSTENSETTGEEGSMEKTNSNSNSTSDSTRREVLAEQKYFGLLLQNFEAIFESLHNKKVLLAALRKDSAAPDHLIADLHDDIHVLSALKKDFRNKLRQALE